MTIHRLDETVSTNLNARAGRPGEVWTAEFQTGGRGRLDHKWTSRKGENLMFSAVFDASGCPPEKVATLPLVVGLAVVRSLARFTKSELSIKWPNDVLANGRKLCGILCERVDDRVIAGLGINVNQTDFPPAIREAATSLARENGRMLDREDVLQSVLAELDGLVVRWRTEGFAAIHPAFAAYDRLKDRIVSVQQTDADSSPWTGLCGGIAVDGSLLVGGRRVFAGEAHILSSRANHG